MNAAHQFQPGLDSVTRTLANAQPDLRWKVFQNVVRVVGGFTGKGLDKSDAADLLQQLAENHDLVNLRGQDAVQKEMAAAFA